MSDIAPESEVTTAEIIPATEVRIEEMATLSLRYVDGVPQLVASGGTVTPAGLTVVDATGITVATYTAGPAEGPPPQARTIAMEDGLRFATREGGR
ncbi:hypothetical protein ABZ408_41215 [Streptomyces tibetensis]|uniref:Uncharacterized protein n=1 Tax=Streptomyces tibetensis TaxID=2382123 RepID=A0ABW6N3X5_9ACTN